MKKILSLFISCLLTLSLSACSSNTNSDYAIDFFNALDNTLALDSGHIQGTFISNNEEDSMIHFDLKIDQKDELQMALDLDLEAGGNTEDDFIDFYIKDGKTYLNYMNTTSQSLLENLGIDASQKLSLYNPFLDHTDEELRSLFTKCSKSQNEYSFIIDASMLSAFMDSMGSITIEDAILNATIKDDYITSLKLQVTGLQDIETQQAVIDVTLECSIKQINTLDKIDFPDNLDSYGNNI